MKDVINRFKLAIEGAQKILITTHLFPDADGIGAQIALCLALRKQGKDVFCVNEEGLLDRYKYLDKKNTIHGLDSFKKKKKEWTPDLIVVVDTNTIFRTGHRMMSYTEKRRAPVLYVDHHPCAQHIRDEHCIDTNAAATGQIIGELIKSMGIAFDQDMALPLYTAILIDTSSFRYPTVSADTHQLIAELISTGIKPPQAYNHIYGTSRIEHMHLLGKVLLSANCNKSEEIAWIVLKKKDLESYEVDIEDTHAFINHLLILDRIKVACMFRDDGNQLKISFRSTGKVDVGIIAAGLGGGGHSHSAATIISCSTEKNLDELIQNVIKEMEKLLKSAS